MNWIWIAGLGLFAVAAGGIWYAVTRTDYLPRLFIYLVKLALPVIIEYLMKRKDPELEAKWRQAIRQGQDWDEFRNRPREKH